MKTGKKKNGKRETENGERETGSEKWKREGK